MRGKFNTTLVSDAAPTVQPVSPHNPYEGLTEGFACATMRISDGTNSVAL